MYRLRSLKYLMTISLITAILLVISYISQLVKVSPTSQSLLQFGDGVMLGFFFLIPGPCGLIAGPLYAGLLDCLTGYFIFIPVSILVRVIMFLIVNYLSKYLTYYVTYFLAVLMIIIFYVPYNYLLFNSAVAITELVVDGIQAGVSYVVAVALYLTFKTVNKNNYLWNDHQFDQYKDKKSQKESTVI